MPLLFIAIQNSKTPFSDAERGFLRSYRNALIETIVRHVRAFIFEVIDKIANKYIYLFRDLAV